MPASDISAAMRVGVEAPMILTSPHEAAGRLRAYMARADFGSNPVGDVRDPA